MKLLLHCCCAPCSVSCITALRNEKIEPDFFWYNPNIHPRDEYILRRDSLLKLAANENIKLEQVDEYGLEVSAKSSRCETCYRIRLEKAASFAATEGYTAFTTTLLISPYQNHEAIRRLGEEAAAKAGVDFLYRDFRPHFRNGQAQAREQGLYMQKYCGCTYSKDEASKPNVLPSCKAKEQQTASPLERLALITGNEGLEKLKNASVLVFGAGGVGSWAAEALARSGVGRIGIIDSDTVCASNINRQVEATSLTLGLPKASLLKKRLLEINPSLEITAWDELFCKENASLFGIENANYVIDAIDTLNHKLDLIQTVCGAGVTLFSSMGMAQRIDPSQIKVTSIWDTHGCALARHVRQGLRQRGFSSDFTVVYSSEKLPRTASPAEGERPVNGSIVTVTASAGLFLASLVLRDITGL